MRRMMIRYTVKADRAQENQRYIERVFAELDAVRPAGLRYASFVLPDGISFVHLVALERDDGSNPLLALEAFRAFTAKIADRCEGPPVSVELQEIGAYRLFGAEDQP